MSSCVTEKPFISSACEIFWILQRVSTLETYGRLDHRFSLALPRYVISLVLSPHLGTTFRLNQQ